MLVSLDILQITLFQSHPLIHRLELDFIAKQEQNEILQKWFMLWAKTKGKEICFPVLCCPFSLSNTVLYSLFSSAVFV
jgi:hypothetical protein